MARISGLGLLELIDFRRLVRSITFLSVALALALPGAAGANRDQIEAIVRAVQSAWEEPGAIVDSIQVSPLERAAWVRAGLRPLFSDREFSRQLEASIEDLADDNDLPAVAAAMSKAFSRARPGDADAYRALAVIAAPDDGDIAAEAMRNVANLDRGDFATWLVLGQFEGLVGNVSAARMAFAEARSIVGDTPNTFHLWRRAQVQEALLLASQGDVMSALGMLESLSSRLRQRLAQANNPGLVSQLAENDYYIARLLEQVGNLAGAAEAYRRAAEGQVRTLQMQGLVGFGEPIVDRSGLPQGPESDIIIQIERLSSIYGFLGDKVRVMELMGNSLARRRALLAQDPNNRDQQHGMIFPLLSIGDSFRSNQQYDVAIGFFLEAAAITGGLVADDPTNPSWLKDHAQAWVAIAVVHRHQGNKGQAIAATRTSVDALDAAASLDPGDVAGQRARLTSHALLASQLAENPAHKSEALDHLDTALSIAERLEAIGEAPAARALSTDALRFQIDALSRRR